MSKAIFRALMFSTLLSLMGLQDALAADRFDDLRARIRKDMAEQSIPSLAIAVAQDGRIVWEEGFGWADREKRIAATQDTPYSIASITKPITATGLMTLVRDGKIDLDKPVEDYLGGAKLHARIGDARAATVRRVAGHSAGLPVYAHFYYDDEGYRRPPMEETIRRYGNLVAPPGERFEYSNLGYGLLDHAISQVSGLSYADYMSRAVFAPLGMTRTSVDIVPDLAPYAAARYDVDGTVVPFYDFGHPGASAVFSSAHDLVLFGMFQLKDHLPEQRAILSDAQIDEMQRPVASLKKGAGTAVLPAYSIGFFVDDKNGYRVVSHSGGMVGVATEMLLVPDHDIVIVALSNSSTALPFETAQAIAGVLLPRWKPTPRRVETVPAPFATPAALLGRWKGRVSTYTGDKPVELVFQPDGDVHATMDGQLETLVNEALSEDGKFSGTFASYLDTPDAARYEHVIDLSLVLRGETLEGVAKTAAARKGKRSPRSRDALPHWIELRRSGQ